MSHSVHDAPFALTLLFQPRPASDFQIRFNIKGLQDQAHYFWPNDSDVQFLTSKGIGWRLPTPPIIEVTAIQAKASQKTAQQLNAYLEKPWPVYLMQAFIQHAKACGFKAIALLRPEFNPFIHAYLLGISQPNKTEFQAAERLYYSTARKCGFAKPKNSRHLWKLLE